MNLHQIASGAITAVNPFITGTMFSSLGYTTAPDGERVPSYADPVVASIQVQQLTSEDLKQTEGLEIQGATRSVYLNGTWNGIVRPLIKGGDMLVFNNQNWLVVAVPESWPDWTKIIVCLQTQGIAAT
jgi:hypothetical protein